MLERNKLQKISSRGWTDIVQNWSGHIDTVLGSELKEIQLLSDVPDFIDVLKATGKEVKYVEDLDKIRNLILTEAIYLIYKSLHLLNLNRLENNSGFFTWTISNTYKSAYFQLKAISALLGITTIDYKERTYLIDVWTSPEKISKSQLKKGNKPIQQTQILHFHKTLNHTEKWQIFSRIINTLNCPFFSKDFKKTIRLLEPDVFARERNKIHYWSHYWTYNDLNQKMISNPITEACEDFDLSSDDLGDKSELIIKINEEMLLFSQKLVQDLAKKIPIFSFQNDFIKTRISRIYPTLELDP